MSLSKAPCHAKTAILAHLFSKCSLAHLSLLSRRRPKRGSDSEQVLNGIVIPSLSRNLKKKN